MTQKYTPLCCRLLQPKVKLCLNQWIDVENALYPTPNEGNTQITYTGQKLNTRFQIKDKIVQIHKNDLVDYVKCPDQSSNQDYLGETGRKIIERTPGDSGKDKYSHLFKHACNENYKHVDLVNIKVIDSVIITTDLKEKCLRYFIFYSINQR